MYGPSQGQKSGSPASALEGTDLVVEEPHGRFASVQLPVSTTDHRSEHHPVLTGTPVKAGAGHHSSGTSSPAGPAPTGGPAGFIPGDRDAGADLDGHTPPAWRCAPCSLVMPGVWISCEYVGRNTRVPAASWRAIRALCAS